LVVKGFYRLSQKRERRGYEHIRGLILLTLTQGPTTVNKIANETGINWKTVDNHIIHLLGKGHITTVFKSAYVKIYTTTSEGEEYAQEIKQSFYEKYVTEQGSVESPASLEVPQEEVSIEESEEYELLEEEEDVENEEDTENEEEEKRRDKASEEEEEQCKEVYEEEEEETSPLKILMFGWEFPPFKSGGLGTACYDLTKGLSRQGVEVTFIMPNAPKNAKADFVKLMGVSNVKVRGIDTPLTPYMTAEGYDESVGASSAQGGYGRNMLVEVERLAKAAVKIAREEPHDLIHTHDWMTYKAGLAAQKVSGKPIISHLHATEFDRTGNNPNKEISKQEYEGLAKADMIITNSNFSKKNMLHHYKLPKEKVKVVHWGIEQNNPYYRLQYQSRINQGDKVVLFLGRVTVQKGPDYFVEAARHVLKHVQNVKFVLAGNGDMLSRMIDKVVEHDMVDKFIFTGFLRGKEVHQAFQMANVYVMPSVSEPFGLVALEALKNNTPIIVSKQSGVSEVIKHALKVDFWDVNELTNKIVGVLKHKELQEELRKNGHYEARKHTIDKPAEECVELYYKVLNEQEGKRKNGRGRTW
jgi:glycogen synthase